MRLLSLPLSLLAVAALPSAALAETTDQTLRVVGHGVAHVAPDTADLSIGVDAVRATAVAARNAVNSRTARILRAERALGIAAADLQTSDTSLERQRRGRRGHRVVRWEAASSLEIHVRDLANVSRALDAAARLGATSFDGPNFGFSDPGAGQPQAENAALSNARARADAAAAAVGLRVVGVRSIDLDPGTGASFDNSASADAAAPAPSSHVPTPVAPGLEEIDADVTVVYLLGA
jgi:uncharacterized protein YggE